MKVALIGYGYWGGIIKRYIEDSVVFDLVGVCGGKESNGLDSLLFQDILESKEIEAVFICTPIETHFNLCKKCLKANKHVFCEKPTVKVLYELDELLTLARERKCILYTDYIYLESESIKMMKKLLPEIGDIKYVQAKISQFGKFYLKDDVYEVLGVHMISALEYILEISCDKIEFIDFISTRHCLCGKMKLFFSQKFIVEVFCSLIEPLKERKISIYGESGLLVFDSNKFHTLQMFLYENDSLGYTLKNEKNFDIDETNNLSRAIEHFYEIILSKNNVENERISYNVLRMLENR